MTQEIRRSISGLKPGTRYIVRVRAVNAFGVPSAWSESLGLETEDLTEQPPAPTSIIYNFDGEDLILSWTPPVTPSNSLPVTDLWGYWVDIIRDYNTDDETRLVTRYFTTTNNFVYFADQNEDDWSGTGLTTLTVEVTAVNISGVESDPLDLTITKTNTFRNHQNSSDTYTLVIGDKERFIDMQRSGANSVQIPLNSSVPFPVGTEIKISQRGTGTTTITPIGGVTLQSKGATVGSRAIVSQFGIVTVLKIETDTWYVFGDVA